MDPLSPNKRSQRTGGTEQLCSPVVQTEVSGSSPPPLNRDPLI